MQLSPPLTCKESTSDSWKQELLHSYTSPNDLLQAGLITLEEASHLEKLSMKFTGEFHGEFKKEFKDEFKIRITPYYGKLIQPSKHCPIRAQAIPHLLEKDPSLPAWAIKLSQKIYGRPTPWHPDAIGDVRHSASPRLTHRYQNRAILHLTSLCAVHCRFCFRKSHLSGHEKALYEGTLEAAFLYLKNTPEIRELILTGGDPLSITDSALALLLGRISKIPHIRTVRIHSRMTATLPHRFTDALMECLSQNWGFQLVLVSHFNHPIEITERVRQAFTNLKKTGVTLLNQSVLLRGVNDSVESLKNLFIGLYEMGVLPYYLHHPDWTPGTFHFRISIEKGRNLVSQLRGQLPGPALPDYVLDIPQGFGKISLLGSEIKKIKDLPVKKKCKEIAEKTTVSPLEGAIYEITSPATRTQESSKKLYLDLF